jgi:hypothetical protein
MVREEHYVKLIKVALTKELGKKLSYFIKLNGKHLWQQTTVYRTVAKCNKFP